MLKQEMKERIIEVAQHDSCFCDELIEIGAVISDALHGRLKGLKKKELEELLEKSKTAKFQPPKED